MGDLKEQFFLGCIVASSKFDIHVCASFPFPLACITGA
jgi:hypothetical protein